jgi:periplasmic copper chaperone A
MTRRLLASLLALALVAVAAACSSGGADDTGDGLTVTDAWARPSTGMGRAGAVYLEITGASNEADVLLRAASPAATTVEIHETSMGADGTMGMQQVDRIEIAAGGTVVLEPGGLHIMLIDLTGELAAGSTIDLTLTFEKAGEIAVTAEVRVS